MRTPYPTKKLREVVKPDTRRNIKDNLPYIGMEDIESGTGRIIFEPKVQNVKSTTFHFDSSVVLYGKLRPYLNKVYLPDFEGHTSTEFIPLLPKKDELDREYLSHWLRSQDTVDKIITTVSGTRMPRADLDQVFEFRISLPPLPEQKKIVKKIEELFGKIDEAQKLREEAQADATALIPDALHQIFEEGKQKGWGEQSVEEITDKVQYGYTASAKQSGNAQLLRITDIQNNHVNWDTVPFCDCENIENYKLQNGDIVFARTGATVGKSFLINNPPKNAIFASYLIRAVVNKNQSLPEFLYYFFQSSDYWSQVMGHAVGGAQPNVNGTKLKKLRLLVPPLPEQKKIVAYLDSLSEKAKKLQELQSQTAAELKALKQSILHKAFSGELVR